MALPAHSEELPTLLVVGGGEPMWEAIEAGLERHATFAEAADKDSAAAAAVVAAPDVILLVGDAARDRAKVLEALAAHPITRVLPVIILVDGGNLSARLDATRRGVTFVERGASSDGVAREIARLCRSLPDRKSNVGGELGETSLAEVLEIIKTELQSGILSVKGDEQGARFVLRSGRQVGDAIKDFVERIRPLVETSEGPLTFDFESADSREMPLFRDDADTNEGDLTIFRDRRVVLVEDDSAAADAMAQELRAHGAQVVVVTSSGSGIHRARDSDPEIVLVEEHALDGPTYEVLQTLRRDPRLRWASLLVIRREELLPTGEAPRMDRLAMAFETLLAPDAEIARLALECDEFDTRLEALGPSRLLRTLANAGRTLRATIRHPRTIVEVSFAEGLIAGAQARKPGQAASQAVGGPTALAALFAVGSGRVRVEARAAPATANVLAPPAAAIAAAAAETPPIKPSLPPPPNRPGRPSQPPQQLLAQLEQVLGDLEAAGMIRPNEFPGDATEEVSRPASFSISAPAWTEPARPAPRSPIRSARASAFSEPGRPKSTLPTPAVEPQKYKPPAPPPVAPRALGARGKKKSAHNRTLVGMAAPAAAPEDQVEVFPNSDSKAEHAPLAMHAATTEVSEPASLPGFDPSLATSTSLDPDASATTGAALSNLPPPAPSSAGPWTASVPPPTPPMRTESAAVTARSAAAPLADSAAALPSAEPLAIEESYASATAADPLAIPRATSTKALLPSEDTYVVATTRRRVFWGMVTGAAAAVFALSAAAAFYFGGTDETAEVAAPAANNLSPSATETSGGPAPAGAEPVAIQPVHHHRAPPDDDGAATEEVRDASEEASDDNEDRIEANDAEAEDTSEADDASEGDVEENDDSETGESEDGENEDDIGNDGGRGTVNERVDALVNAGNFFRNRRNYRLAERRYLSALRLRQNNARALTGLALCHIAQREGGKALTYARRLVRSRSRSAGAQVILGDALKLSGDRDGARSAYRRALQLNPRHRGARSRLD